MRRKVVSIAAGGFLGGALYRSYRAAVGKGPKAPKKRESPALRQGED